MTDPANTARVRFVDWDYHGSKTRIIERTEDDFTDYYPIPEHLIAAYEAAEAALLAAGDAIARHIADHALELVEPVFPWEVQR
jgi:hypothetical protein